MIEFKKFNINKDKYEEELEIRKVFGWELEQIDFLKDNYVSVLLKRIVDNNKYRELVNLEKKYDYLESYEGPKVTSSIVTIYIGMIIILVTLILFSINIRLISILLYSTWLAIVIIGFIGLFKVGKKKNVYKSIMFVKEREKIKILEEALTI